LAREGLPGVRFVPAKRTPVASVHKGKECGGVDIFVDDWKTFRPVPTGLAIAWTLQQLYPRTWQVERFDVLLRHRQTWGGWQKGSSWGQLEAGWQEPLRRFLELRRAYLLYPDR